MVEVALDSCRIQNSRKNDLSSRTQPAARQFYAIVHGRESGFVPWEPQRAFQVRTGYLQWEDFHLSATYRLLGVPQNRSSFAGLERSCHAPCASDGCYLPWPQGQSQNNCCHAVAPRGVKIPTLNLYKDRRGASRKFLRNSQGGIPQKRETADGTSKLSEWICQKVTKSHLDMCMIGTELKGEMLRFLYLAASMSSTISLYNRTILRQCSFVNDERP